MTSREDRIPVVAAVIGALSFLPAGLWAMVAPRSFFEQLATFEPYNQHFIQDIGAFQIGIGAVLVLAAVRRGMPALPVALLGSGVGALAHVISHIVGRDLGGRPGSDIVLFSITALILLVAGWVGASRARSA